MNTDITTRKLPVPWSEKTKSRGRGHLVPDVLSSDFSRLLNLESYKTTELGAIVFLGVAIGPNDVEAKIRKKIPNFVLSKDARSSIVKFFTSLSGLKIGNVIRLEVDGSAVVVREHAISAHKTTLP